jgi:hypothetical protein
MFASMGMPELLRAAEQDEEIYLPRLEPGWQGAALAVAGAALGEGWAVLTKMGSEPSAPAVALEGTSSVSSLAILGPAMGWLALILIFAGLLIQLSTWRERGGWRVNLSRREFSPHGLAGEVHAMLNPKGYALSCVAGDRFRSVAIDLRHEERGRIARIFQTPARTSMRNIRACSELTDVLAGRLGVAREGLRV